LDSKSLTRDLFRDLGIHVDFLREDEEAEYKRIKRELIKTLKKLGGYEPSVDGIYVDDIAKNSIYLGRVEAFLDLDTASEGSHTRIIDTRLKLRKMIDTAMHHLAITRRDRLSSKTEKGIREELREALIRATKNVARQAR